MSESEPLVPWTAPDPSPLELPAASRPQRPIFTIIVLVTITVIVTGVLTGRFSTSPATAVGTWSPTTTTDIAGDSWDGDLVTDGSRVYLMTREDIEGFWGVLKVRWSDDAGATWSEPTRVSTSGTPDAARHALAIEPDGTLWAAWAQRGPQVATQRLMLRRSGDRGQTWDKPTRVTGDDIGEIGVPALVMSAGQRFVAYTDGVTGRVLVQPLDERGQEAGDVTLLDVTRRDLYSDQPFLDAGLAASSIGDRAVIATHAADHVSIQVTADHVAFHDTAVIKDVTWAAPRLAVDGDRLLSMVSTTGGSGAQIVASASDDRGDTWTELGRWTGAGAGPMSIATAPAGAFVVWQACGTSCRSAHIHVADMSAMAAGGWIIAGADGRHPAGAVLVGTTMVVAWIREGPSGRAGERVLTVASGPMPRG